MRIVEKSLLLAAALWAASAGADPFPQDGLNWLQTMAFAAHQTDYSGIFVYQYGDHVETSRITHIVDADGEYGRLESLDGPRREVIRHNDETWCYMGDRKVKMEAGAGGREFPAVLPQQLALLSENYTVKPAEEERLAGFHAHAILFEPKDNLRYTHKMWADSNSGLLLKSEVLDEHGNVIEQYSFSQLTIGGNLDRSWIEKPAGADIKKTRHTRDLYAEKIPHTASQAGSDTINSGWRVDALPPGFKKIAEVRRQLKSRDEPVIQIVYSDGLAGISVFIEPSDNDDDDHPGLSSQGMIQIYSRVTGNFLVTVVGEVPPGTAMQVGDSVRGGS